MNTFRLFIAVVMLLLTLAFLALTFWALTVPYWGLAAVSFMMTVGFSIFCYHDYMYFKNIKNENK